MSTLGWLEDSVEGPGLCAECKKPALEPEERGIMRCDRDFEISHDAEYLVIAIRMHTHHIHRACMNTDEWREYQHHLLRFGAADN